MSTSLSQPNGCRATNSAEAVLEPIRVGSGPHRDLIVDFFRRSHLPYEPREFVWPELPSEDVARLRSLPVWDEARKTERLTARLVKAYATHPDDPALREVIALQGYEEGRHAQLIELMVRRYGLADGVPVDPALPEKLDWAFLRVGYGECFDSFFAFGLFELARRSGLFPRALVEMFEPVIQEEARHILFFVNWVAYERARRPAFVRPFFSLRCAGALLTQVWQRVRDALRTDSDPFMNGQATVQVDVRPRAFLELCLRENDRRLGMYDPRLLRPTVVPAIARFVSHFLPGGEKKQGEPRASAVSENA